MPGQQRKRRNQQRGGPLRGAGAGRWEVVFETQDAAEWQSSVPRIRSELGLTDASMLRVDTLRGPNPGPNSDPDPGPGPGPNSDPDPDPGRAEPPTTYRLSMFVPYPQTAPQPEPPEQPNG
ncbi:hypothetical protein OG372_12340 [Streptomyces sp. NBC_01020]|uniref:hypothetical protein n=1 Tax=Streptomyces sp. NBC_01020 TaxID=2903722 RepID=UPI00386BC322|nr:hypothetical protein OG372_12340 [Streptomyces sp. NBC_01020]